MKSVLRATRITAVLIAVSCWGGVAWGRAVVVQTVPANGEVLARAPKEITLRFDRQIQASKVRLNFSDVSGRRVLALPKQHQESGLTDHLTITMPIMGRGSYILRYKVVDAKGEPSFGSVSFTAGGY